MKTKLGTLELKILKELSASGSNTMSGLALALKRSKTRVSLALKDLETKGFIETERVGISKKVSFSRTMHALLLKTLFSRDPYVRFERLFSGSALEILLSIAYDGLTMMDIAEQSGRSIMTVKRVIRKMREIGMVVRSEKADYRINDRFIELQGFVREFQYYLNLQKALSFSVDSVILWQRGKEFLIKTLRQEESSNFFLTSITAYHKYGVELILLDYNYYFYSPIIKSLKLEDIILHGLVLDSTDTRAILYAMLVWKKNKSRLNLKHLREEAEKYSLKPIVDAIIDYFENNGRNRAKYFPTWNEFKIKAMKYEI